MRKLTALVLLFAVYMGAVAPFAVSGQIIGRTMENKLKDVPSGLKFRLSEGSEGAAGREVQKPATAEPLTDDASGKLLGRLPAIKTDPDDKAEFAKRIGTLPAPKTGEKIPVKFPAADQQAPPQTGDAKQALEVVRFSPEGDVPLAPDLNVTFSHPMVAVTSQEEAAKYAPVELTPQVEGRWRWLGTRTLMFDTDKRFPMATVFTARVPAGTRSATGQTLQKDFTWTFKTPPPKAIQMIPNGQTTRRDALMFVAFDQAINPQAVLESITVTGGGKRLPVRLATEAETLQFKYYIDQAQPGRWLAFRAVNATGGVEDALPADSPISVTINKGTPSAEGPLTTTAAQSFSFRTYGAMKATEFVCGWQRNRNCSPFEQWMVTFTNTIDASKFTKEMVTIEPAVEGLNIYPAGNYIYIQGPKKGRTTYKVTVSGELTDIYGQKLGTAAVGTIKTGSAESNLYSQGGPMTVLDPQAKPSFSFYSTNHKSARVKVYRVQPEQWNEYVQYVRYLNYDDGRRPMMPGQLISNEVVQIESVADDLVETRVDLSKFLSGGLGHLVLDIEPTVKKDQYDRTRIITWLQATKIGLDAFVDNSELVGFATELATGKPLSGVGLTIYPNDGVVTERSYNGGETGTTFFGSIWNWISSWGSADPTENTSVDADGSAVELETIEPAQSKQTGPNGVLRLELAEKASNKGQNLLIARRGKDSAFLPENSDYYWQDYGTWHKKGTIDSLRWFVFDDRRMYKPNEEVSVKGYLRKQTAGKLGDIEPLGDAASGITWSARDPRNNEIATGTANLNAFGAFDLKFKLPDNANLGYASIQFSTSSGLAGTNYSHQFQIQEFRRPEFEVTAKVDSEAPHFVGGKADLSVEAKYYSGGGLANAETNWTVTAMPTSYTPPNRDDFTFGTWVPWWRGDFYGGPRGSGSTQYFKGTTDAEGKHHLKIDFESVKPPRPYTISASASVQDVNRQTWAGQTSLLVHPSDLYVGIRTPRTFVQKGEKITVESIVSHIDGKLIAGRDVEIKAVLKDWRFDAGSWKEVTIDEQVCSVKSAEAAVKCEFVAKNGGRYTITATVMDDRERFNESEFMVWVPGGKTPPNRSVEQEEVQIIPSQKEFAPGDVAEILVIAPFTPAEGVLTLRRDGLVKTERFTMKDSSITLKIPIDEKYLPNIYAQVDLVGASPRQNDKGEVDAKLGSRPAFATGNLNLPVSTSARKLTVTAEPADATLAPGGETKVSVSVKDHRGEPVANSEVAVVIVDESVLALSRYTISDPANVFYTPRGSGVQDHHSRKDVLLGNPADVQPSLPPPPPASAGVVDVQENALGRTVSRSKVAALPVQGRAWEMVSAERDDAGGETPINLRENFNALAVWSPSVRTDSNGR
ncbi:MAG TPA: hypothetical protein DEP46_04720, partial [Blastocatellia bacterium]|nr:hypothetical protein [Blastocatellia bacterium]